MLCNRKCCICTLSIETYVFVFLWLFFDYCSILVLFKENIACKKRKKKKTDRCVAKVIHLKATQILFSLDSRRLDRQRTRRQVNFSVWDAFLIKAVQGRRLTNHNTVFFLNLPRLRYKLVTGAPHIVPGTVILFFFWVVLGVAGDRRVCQSRSQAVAKSL